MPTASIIPTCHRYERVPGQHHHITVVKTSHLSGHSWLPERLCNPLLFRNSLLDGQLQSPILHMHSEICWGSKYTASCSKNFILDAPKALKQVCEDQSKWEISQNGMSTQTLAKLTRFFKKYVWTHSHFSPAETHWLKMRKVSKPKIIWKAPNWKEHCNWRTLGKCDVWGQI